MMDDLLMTRFGQNIYVSLQIYLCLFYDQDLQVDFVALNHEVESQDNTIGHLDNTCKEINFQIYLLMEKANQLYKGRIRGRVWGTWEREQVK